MDEHDIELDDLIDRLEASGYVERYIGADGREVVRLTADGEVMAMRLGALDEDGQEDVMRALLGEERGPDSA